MSPPPRAPIGRYAGKVALITGGGRGIGRATALRLAGEGASVAVLDRDGEAAREAADAIGETGARALALEADITDSAAVAAALERTLAAFARVDVLVNNAARAQKPNLAQTEPEDWRSELDGTLTGAYLVSRAVLVPMLRQGSGAVVSIGSVNGLLALGNPARTLAEIRRAGFTLSTGELFPDVFGMAAPVRDFTGEVVAALTVAGPVSRLNAGERRRFRRLMLDAAERLSAELGLVRAAAATG